MSRAAYSWEIAAETFPNVARYPKVAMLEVERAAKRATREAATVMLDFVLEERLQQERPEDACELALCENLMVIAVNAYAERFNLRKRAINGALANGATWRHTIESTLLDCLFCEAPLLAAVHISQARIEWQGVQAPRLHRAYLAALGPIRRHTFECALKFLAGTMQPALPRARTTRI